MNEQDPIPVELTRTPVGEVLAAFDAAITGLLAGLARVPRGRDAEDGRSGRGRCGARSESGRGGAAACRDDLPRRERRDRHRIGQHRVGAVDPVGCAAIGCAAQV